MAECTKELGAFLGEGLLSRNLHLKIKPVRYFCFDSQKLSKHFLETYTPPPGGMPCSTAVFFPTFYEEWHIFYI